MEMSIREFGTPGGGYGSGVPARRREREISLLFDLFVLNQHVRRLLVTGLAGAPLRADEYAVYSVLFEQGPLTGSEISRRLGMPLTTLLDYLRAMEGRGHLRRRRHPGDGRARELELTVRGVAVHRKTNVHWEKVRSRLEKALPVPSVEVRRALQALDDAALATLADLEAQASAG
jgi:DNA-binding MarR family transcriptional regulator